MGNYVITCKLPRHPLFPYKGYAYNANELFGLLHFLVKVEKVAPESIDVKVR